MKTKFLDINNLVRGLKGMIVGITSSLIMFIPYAIYYFFKMEQMFAVALGLGISFLLFYLNIWGWLARTWFNWK